MAIKSVYFTPICFYKKSIIKSVCLSHITSEKSIIKLKRVPRGTLFFVYRNNIFCDFYTLQNQQPLDIKF